MNERTQITILRRDQSGSSRTFQNVWSPKDLWSAVQLLAEEVGIEESDIAQIMIDIYRPNEVITEKARNENGER